MGKTLITEFKKTALQYENLTALYTKNQNKQFETISFKQLYEMLSQWGTGLLELGVKKGDHIGILSDNRKEWIIADLGILGIGAIDVPRGSDSTSGEIHYIFTHAECSIVLVEDEIQLKRVLSINSDKKQLKILIVMDEQFQKTEQTQNEVKIFTFSEILQIGKKKLEKNSSFFDQIISEGDGEEIATIIYTSGTTGEPKGVMLTHNNFLHQVRSPHIPLDVNHKDIAISVLPIWHSFERSVEYFLLFSGASIAYSKPIAKVMLSDMEAVKPTAFPSVPRIWEAIRDGIYKKVNSDGGIKKFLFNFFITIGTAYSKLSNLFCGLKPQFKKRIIFIDMLISIIPLILLTPLIWLGNLLVFKKLKKKLGGNFRFGISGAGALPPHVDNFFAAAGILLLEGYGLTEAAPICSVRLQKAPVTNTIGPLLPEISMKILDTDGNELPPGKKGILFIKGPNVMKGYFKRPQETALVLSDDGWLNTGDLAMKTYNNELKILGREKETIVLRSGENVEPEPIENCILQSKLIDNVLIVGQDQKFLSALIVPNLENLQTHLATEKIKTEFQNKLLDLPEVQKIFKDELNMYINAKKGFKAFESIIHFTLLKKNFEPGVELTQSLKMKRNIITSMYKKEIKNMYAEK